MKAETKLKIFKLLSMVLTVYFFLLSIKLLGHSFESFGQGFAETILRATSNPFAGLIIGIVTTSLIQSSSTTTSIIVGLVAGGVLSLSNAIPIVMGANIGTTITNILVSFGHVTKRAEFRRAFSAAIVHDFFNICAVIVLFPLELKLAIIQKTATFLEKYFAQAGGLEIFNPLKLILDPAVELITVLFSVIPYHRVMLLIFSVLLLFSALTFLIKIMRSLVLDKLEIIINNYLFRNDLFGFILGLLMTAIVQSSSVTTSLIIPLAGAGVIRLKQIYPYTLGANIGTTITAILAALATQNHIAVTVAFAHLLFNTFGILIFYPLKFIPITLAALVGEKAVISKKNLIIFIGIVLSVYLIPMILMIIFEINTLSTRP